MRDYSKNFINEFSSKKSRTFQLCECCVNEYHDNVVSLGGVRHPNRYCDVCRSEGATEDALMDLEWIKKMRNEMRYLIHDTNRYNARWPQNIFDEQ